MGVALHAYITSHHVLQMDAIIHVHREPWQLILQRNSSACPRFATVVRNSRANMVPLEIGSIICGI